MRFDLSPEQRDLGQVLRRLLAGEGTIEAIVVRSRRERDRADPLWRRLSAEMGLVGLTLGAPGERIGTHVDLGVVARELGRVLYPGPYFSTVLAATSLEAAASSGNHPAAASALSGVAEHGTAGTVAGFRAFGQTPLTARPEAGGGSWSVDGTDGLVLDGLSAEIVVAVADTGGSTGLFLLECPEDLHRAPRPHIDLNREIASVEFTRARARLLIPDASALHGRLVQLACGYLASEQVGAAGRCLELMVEHATQRRQFGRPIGSFQAVKHLCAQAALIVESLDVEVLYATHSLDDPVEATSTVARMAKSAASDGLFEVAGSLIQVLGGMGFTWEHAAHHYFRRATSSRQLFGTPTQHRDVVAGSLLAGIRP